MVYLAFALNVLIIAVLLFELHQGRQERRQLSLLIKSRDVQEFVRAETALRSPDADEPAEKDNLIDIDDPDVDPAKVAAALSGSPPAA